VDHPLPHVDQLIRPWRTATLVAAAIAGVELLLLVVVAGALLARPDDGQPHKRQAQAKVVKQSIGKPAAVKPATQVAAKPALARTKVSVLVLNGNGVQGAAAAEASKVERRGYRIRAVTNAPRMDFVRSVVMYRAGFAPEAQRLAKDLGIGMVGPLDGIRPGQLLGAHTVVVVGA
jgi:hypothetical protein